MKKNRILITAVFLFLAIGNAALSQSKNIDNTLTKKEIKKGWKLLFDGSTSNGWMNLRTKSFPANGWEIKDGTISINPASKQQNGGGDIVSTDRYSNFELTFDFKYTPGANSGVKYFIDPEGDNGTFAAIGCEYQVLDDKLHPDAKAGINGNRTLGSLYDLIPASTNKIDNGPDKWNTAIIKVKGNKVQHWLNGKLVLQYERGNDAWRAVVATSKFKPNTGFGEAKNGRILLQDHGNVVFFKNIKIRELK
jgi:hypothetical protein